MLPFLLCQQTEKGDHLPGQIQDVKGGFVEHDLPRICPGDREQAVDHLGEPSDFLQHAADGVAIFFRRVQTLQTDFADASDGAEGRP